jgi:CBS domain-containing protein
LRRERKAEGMADGHIKSAMGREMHVEDVMTKDVLSVTKYETIVRVANILSEKNISGLPVVDNDKKVVGIITQADILSIVGVSKDHTLKDLLKYMLGEKLPERRMGDIVGDVMTSPVATIQAEANIAEAVQQMAEKKIRRLCVVDGKNRLTGLITRADILRAVLKRLEVK